MAIGSARSAATPIFPSQYNLASTTSARTGNPASSDFLARPRLRASTPPPAMHTISAPITYQTVRTATTMVLDLEPVNDDEGKYLVASNPLSIAQARK